MRPYCSRSTLGLPFLLPRSVPPLSQCLGIQGLNTIVLRQKLDTEAPGDAFVKILMVNCLELRHNVSDVQVEKVESGNVRLAHTLKKGSHPWAASQWPRSLQITSALVINTAYILDHHDLHADGHLQSPR